MQMTMRWFGADKDTVSLEQIRQVPGVVGVVPALHKLPAGEAWPLSMVMDMKKEIEDAGLSMECIESVNVHEDIKLGLPSAEKYIENYLSILTVDEKSYNENKEEIKNYMDLLSTNYPENTNISRFQNVIKKYEPEEKIESEDSQKNIDSDVEPERKSKPESKKDKNKN